MAAIKDPSYFHSIPHKQGIQQKELRFDLFLFQHFMQNQETIVDGKGRNCFGRTVVQDWTIRDSVDVNANIVARAQGLHLGAGLDQENWFICFNIIFFDKRFETSSLKVLGTLNYSGDVKVGEWAIIGGTGEFSFAQGVVKYNKVLDKPDYRVRKLDIRAMCLTFAEQVHVTRIGPWGGNGGTEFDIPELGSQRLESVTIRNGILINSIGFTYVDLAGKKQALGPWGGDGELTDTIHLAPLEIVKEVSGTTGPSGGDTVVTSLTFVTNVRTYGPFGKTDGTAFSVPLKDTNVVGFFVRAGRLVNALGVYVRPSI